MKNTKPASSAGLSRIAMLFALLFLVASSGFGAPADDTSSGLSFCYNWMSKGAGEWINFIFRPPETEVVFLSVGRVFDTKTGVLLNTCEPAIIEIESSDRIIKLPQNPEEVVNPSTWYTLFYTVGNSSSGGVSFNLNILKERLNAVASVLPSGEIVKIYFKVNIFRLDCSSQKFVFDRQCRSDYILVKVQPNDISIIGYNTDSLSGVIGGPPTFLRN